MSTSRTSGKRRPGSAAMHLRIAADQVRRSAGDSDSGATPEYAAAVPVGVTDSGEIAAQIGNGEGLLIATPAN